jgi:hypothetical protein
MPISRPTATLPIINYGIIIIDNIYCGNVNRMAWASQTRAIGWQLSQELGTEDKTEAGKPTVGSKGGVGMSTERVMLNQGFARVTADDENIEVLNSLK